MHRKATTISSSPLYTINRRFGYLIIDILITHFNFLCAPSDEMKALPLVDKNKQIMQTNKTVILQSWMATNALGVEWMVDLPGRINDFFKCWPVAAGRLGAPSTQKALH